ncbi:beta-1,4-galactosyltransferase 1 [Protopterus annectens]|uniref:beta-1,4-galactosyltransferase 1 n=1 Tax=Protopterus annectens TaxID=7888 RepID=UPI001CFB992E|nr:beta-1,4-galactosyltransferase 1 [Protopterus annectens]
MADRVPLPGSILKKTCCIVVFVCALHLSVTLVYYLSGQDQERIIHFFFQSHTTSPTTTSETPELRTPTGSNFVMVAPQANPVKNELGTKANNLPPCPETPPRLVGPLKIEFNQPVTLEEVKDQNPNVNFGGRFTPNDCIALQKVAVIIPFRNRDEHLKYYLYYMHPIFQRQQLDYGIYVINQDGEGTFNRAKLLNVGYMEALKEYDYNCFVFSDVDLIPLDDRNLYRCFNQPRHLTVAMDKFGFRLPYTQFFGGAASFSKEQYDKINGFPNQYWGWGGEDDDIYNRVTIRGMEISRPDGLLGRCRMIRHDRDDKNADNPERFNRLAHTRQTIDSDGLNTLTYTVIRTEKFDLYTKITVDVGSPPR